jgi:hypothetical protein
MLAFFDGKASERKLRLFAAACCRRIWDGIPELCSRPAVEISESYADGRANDKELEAAFLAADRAHSTTLLHESWSTRLFRDAARLAAHPEIRGLADGTATAAAMAAAGRGEDFWRKSASEQAHQCILLRDIFGNPFRSVALAFSWLSWHDGLLVSMAQQMYDSRDFADLPVLADALEEAGCTNQDILGHCRSGGVHVRGCWVVDLVLGKS